MDEEKLFQSTASWKSTTMMKYIQQYLLIILTIGMSGCATLILRNTEPMRKDDRQAPIYQGTRIDLYGFYRILPLIDLPLSFVADTVLLPVTIREQFFTGDLQRAAERGDISRVSNLLANGTDVNSRDSYGQTALMASARTGQEKVIGLLLENGADVNAKSIRTKTTPLMFALMNYQEAIANVLLAKGADINSKDHRGVTALMFAAGYGSEEFIQSLIARGADIHAMSDSGQTALFFAAARGDTN